MTHRALIVALITLAACASEEVAAPPAPSAREAETVRMQNAAEGLCEAQLLIRSGDLQAASNTFFSTAHVYLHELAMKLGTFERQAATELLQADQQFEAALAARDPNLGKLDRLVVALAREFAEAAVAAGLPSPRCEDASP